jgi:hypothetical protein
MIIWGYCQGELKCWETNNNRIRFLILTIVLIKFKRQQIKVLKEMNRRVLWNRNRVG